jgi:hypothetical protein
MTKAFALLTLIWLATGCAIATPIQVTRVAHYDRNGNLVSYEVRESRSVIANVPRTDSFIPIELWNTTRGYGVVPSQARHNNPLYDNGKNPVEWPPVPSSPLR